MYFPIFCSGKALSFFKKSAKIGVIIKSYGFGNFVYRGLCLAQQFFGFFYAHFGYMLDYGLVKSFSEQGIQGVF